MVIHLGLSIWAMLPNQRNGKGYYGDEEDEDDHCDNSPIRETKNAAVEMQHMRFPLSPQPIFTPRTQAFNMLDGRIQERRWG